MGQEKIVITNRRNQKSFLKGTLLGQKGQLAVEYVLMVVAAVTVATLIVTALVSRSTDEPGLVIQVWQNIVNAIGNDNAAEP
ncbi:MAG: hypothetical protein VX583_00195 [Bdellovibrionota bacterium]|nr:hypothetical protein [Pseudobdellovibrionaceae bacterium]|tara:strand:+ start:17112 stop:17357 length:246 start_codon:yes stop_codon:yes gene_type:complete